MGGSDWRERYQFDDFAHDAEACARAAGLYEGGRKQLENRHRQRTRECVILSLFA